MTLDIIAIGSTGKLLAREEHPQTDAAALRALLKKGADISLKDCCWARVGFDIALADGSAAPFAIWFLSGLQSSRDK